VQNGSGLLATLKSVAKLIVNADDFGLTAGVNHAVVTLHRAGVLTSTTLMARARATDEAVQAALAAPSLGVGCHVVLVDGEPLLKPAVDLHHLADPQRGGFRRSLAGFLPWVLGLERGGGSAAEREREIEAEAFAQMASLLAKGLQITHVDTHKHTHMFPAVLRPVLRAAKRAGVRVVRNPFEPRWSVAATPRAPWLRRFEVNTLRRLEARFRRIVAAEGFATTDGALGVLATGTLNAATVLQLVRALPQNGIYELVSHPGVNDADLAEAGTRLLASRAVECEALMCLQNRTKLGRPEVELVSFAALSGSV